MADQDEARRKAALDARNDLKAFLGELQDLLAGCITERPELFRRGVDDLGRAWARIEPRFGSVGLALDRKDASGKDLSKARSDKLDRELEQHGLAGEELALKLNLFRRLAADFLDELAAQDEAEEFWSTWVVRLRGSSRFERFLSARLVRRLESLRRAGRRIVRGRLKQALDAANVVLGSLGPALAFLPGVGAAVGGIGEFKDAMEVVLAEPDEAEKPPRPRDAANQSDEPGPALRRLRFKLR